MSTASLPLPDPDALRSLFGAQDANLKKIRDSLGVSIVARGDHVILDGDEAQVARGREVIEELLAIIGRHGFVRDEEIVRLLQGTAPDDEGQRAAINLFEKAKHVIPRTAGQASYVEAIRKNDLVFCTGPAGCGKTYLAVAMAVNALRQEFVRKIVLVRPAVEAGEKLGYLPGDMLAKINPFLRPLLDAMNDMLDFESVKRYIEGDVIEIVPLAFMRGRTLNETFIILDEAQNTTMTQMKMFLTRMGEGSKIVVTGDGTQSDLPTHVTSGLLDATRRLHAIESVAVVELTGRDIVRHRLVREIVAAYDAESKAARSGRNPEASSGRKQGH